MPAAYPHTASAIEYAEKVVDGLIPTGRLAVAACRRFLEDLDRSDADPTYRWEFRPDLAERPMTFASLLPNIKGPEAGKPLRLMQWQQLAYANIFGWVEKGTTIRRFRQASIWCPRGSGKTSVSAPLALYCGFVEGEGGAEVYAAAVTQRQARLLWDTAARMATRSPAFRKRYGIHVGAHAIYQQSTASTFAPVSSDASSLDGLNVHLAVLDEIGSHKTAEVYDVLTTAMGKRLNPLMVTISTPTGNTTGIGKQLYDLGVHILNGVRQDDRFFALIYGADPEDDIYDEATWIKANPAWGHSVQPDHIRDIFVKAKNNPARENAAKTRHLGLWASVNSAVFSIEAWNRNADPKLRIESFKGRPCYLGLDLASRRDLASIAVVFPDGTVKGGAPKYVVFTRNYYHDAAVKESNVESLAEWALMEHLTVNDGDETDFSVVKDELLKLYKDHDVRSVGFDLRSAAQMAQEMLAAGLPMIEFSQRTAAMSEPIKEVDTAIRSGRMIHDGNLVTSWCIGNAVGHYDSTDCVRINKPSEEQKIDAAVAIVMAVGRASIYVPPRKVSIYETRGVQFV